MRAAGRLARARHTGGRRAVAEIERVRAAAVEHAHALTALCLAIAALPRPCGVSDREEIQFRQSTAAIAKDLIALTEMLAEDVARFCARGRGRS